jgi:ATP-dependent helicase YprA (DUF1998 family)
VKAVLLYPMNALATDQAGRIGDYLAQPEPTQVTAGLYIGDKPDTDFRRVMTRREEMPLPARQQPLIHGLRRGPHGLDVTVSRR